MSPSRRDTTANGKDHWRHCPGILNPADLPSLGLTAHERRTNPTCWNGPSFLCLPKDEWLQDQPTIETNEPMLTELVKNPPEVTRILTTSQDHLTQINLSQIINCDRFSTLDRLLRVTAYVLKFVRTIKKSLCKEANVNKEEVSEFECHNELNARALNQCEVLWICTVQAHANKNKISYLQKDHQMKPHSGSISIFFSMKAKF